MTAMKRAGRYLLDSLEWLPAAMLTGLVCGGVGLLLHFGTSLGSAFRLEHRWVLFLLPVGAMGIHLLYRALELPGNLGANQVLEAVRGEQTLPLALAPAMFLSTIWTHFVGGSAGRQGAALQIGGSLGAGIARLLRCETEDIPLLILCGMASIFTIMFGTPVTAAFFVVEVSVVGRMRYHALLPCLTAALTAYLLHYLSGAERLRMVLEVSGELSVPLVLRVAALAALGAFLSILFCVVIQRGNRLAGTLFQNVFVRALVGGSVVLAVTLLLGTQKYSGVGINLVRQAVEQGEAAWYDFIFKLLLTAVTLAAGYKGGEIAPSLFVGATFGVAAGPLLGLDPRLAAAVSMTALFCGVTNCPVAALVLSVEAFGGELLPLFALTCGVSFVLSGYFGLYTSQRIPDSKVGPEQHEPLAASTAARKE